MYSRAKKWKTKQESQDTETEGRESQMTTRRRIVSSTFYTLVEQENADKNKNHRMHVLVKKTNK